MNNNNNINPQDYYLKKRISFSKIVVAAVIIMNIIFTAAVLYVFSKTFTEPSTLIGSWFAFTTVELWSLASIKKNKENNKENNNDGNAC